MSELEELNRQCQNLYSKSWKLRNSEHVRLMNKLRSERSNITKAIPILKSKLEKYEKRLPEIEKELKANSRYRILGQKRKRNFRESAQK